MGQHFLYVTRTDNTISIKEYTFIKSINDWDWKKWTRNGRGYDRLGSVFKDWVEETYFLLYPDRGYKYIKDALAVHDIRVFDDWTDYRNNNVLTTIFVLDESSGL